MCIRDSTNTDTVISTIEEITMETTLDNSTAPEGAAALQDGDMRLQLALNVPDLTKAIDFYTKLFATSPLKIKPGYANFAIANPPLKLVLFENPTAEPGSINHLGVETESADAVVAAEKRIADAGVQTTGIDETICCFAEKVETWVHGPDGTRWEYYVKEADHDSGFDNVITNHSPSSTESEGACCAPAPEATATTDTAATETVTSCC